jgi:hypothetical protein
LSKIIQDGVTLQNHQENYFEKVKNIYNLEQYIYIAVASWRPVCLSFGPLLDFLKAKQLLEAKSPEAHLASWSFLAFEKSKSS